jgi:hypothetical protein
MTRSLVLSVLCSLILLTTSIHLIANADSNPPPPGFQYFNVYGTSVLYGSTQLGWIAAACEFDIGNGSTIQTLTNGTFIVSLTNGSKIVRLNPCPYPVLSDQGTTLQSAPLVQHVEWGEINPIPGTSWLVLLSDNWNAPGNPIYNDGQTIYLTNAIFSTTLETVTNGLQWGVNSLGGGAFYTIGGWYYNGHTGYLAHSTLITANPGDAVSSTISGSGPFAGCKPSGVCSNWSVTMFDTTKHTSTTFGISNSGPYTDPLAGMLGNNNKIVRCGDYPPGGGTMFSSITLQNGNLQFVYGWTFHTANVVPSCGFGGYAGSNYVEDYYSSLG